MGMVSFGGGIFGFPGFMGVAPLPPLSVATLKLVLQLCSWYCNAAAGVATQHLSKWCCLFPACAASAAGTASLQLVLLLLLVLCSWCCNLAASATILQLVLQPCSQCCNSAASAVSLQPVLQLCSQCCNSAASPAILEIVLHFCG